MPFHSTVFPIQSADTSSSASSSFESAGSTRWRCLAALLRFRYSPTSCTGCWRPILCRNPSSYSDFLESASRRGFPGFPYISTPCPAPRLHLIGSSATVYICLSAPLISTGFLCSPLVMYIWMLWLYATTYILKLLCLWLIVPSSIWTHFPHLSSRTHSLCVKWRKKNGFMKTCLEIFVPFFPKVALVD